MADTSHHHAGSAPTEGDGVSYRGIVWFVVILAVTTFVCQGLMWGLFAFLDRQATKADAQAAPLAVPMALPRITEDGHVQAGRPIPQPNLMVNEPLGLAAFRAKEDEKLTTYTVMDKNAGTYRIPIERAKALILERGIPGGTALPASPVATPVKK
jgi:hypothetical protein